MIWRWLHKAFKRRDNVRDIGVNERLLRMEEDLTEEIEIGLEFMRDYARLMEKHGKEIEAMTNNPGTR